MLGEIDRDFYCSAFAVNDQNIAKECAIFGGKPCNNGQNEKCRSYHRKYPTPEQYQAEYGEDVPDDFPVWECEKHYLGSGVMGSVWNMKWVITTLKEYKESGRQSPIVVACTPWGRPPDDWRPA